MIHRLPHPQPCLPPHHLPCPICLYTTLWLSPPAWTPAGPSPRLAPAGPQLDIPVVATLTQGCECGYWLIGVVWWRTHAVMLLFTSWGLGAAGPFFYGRLFFLRESVPLSSFFYGSKFYLWRPSSLCLVNTIVFPSVLIPLWIACWAPWIRGAFALIILTWM